MLYNDFQGLKLSALGMGCMRFPCIDGDFNRIDIDATREMIDYSIKNGINYFDTAWVYHGGQSESVMGELLGEYPRESYYLATKFPGMDPSLMGKVKEIFPKQLEKCKVDYFDFYLFHSVTEGNIDGYLNPENGVYDYLIEQKKNGRIRHLGFSTHGSLDNMKQFLNAYGKDMEFCQIQLNWFDWDFQNAKEKLELLKEWNLPVWVMEPVRGGSLARLSPVHERKLAELRPGATPAEWAFRFLQSLPGVTMTLSGMSNFEQLKENIETYKESKPLSAEEMNALFEIAGDMTSKNTINCTSCRYCTENCPRELDIPQLIQHYNALVCPSGGGFDKDAFAALEADKKPSACIGCGACEEVCPQGIKISEVMSDFCGRVK